MLTKKDCAILEQQSKLAKFQPKLDMQNTIEGHTLNPNIWYREPFRISIPLFHENESLRD